MSAPANALEAAIRAHDKEDAAQKGEPDPWADDFPEPYYGERMACMQAAIAAWLAALPSEHDRLVERLKAGVTATGPYGGITADDVGAFEDLAEKAAAALRAQAAQIEGLKRDALAVGEQMLAHKFKVAAIRKRVEELMTGLQAIVDRSHNDPLGTSKVIDMRNIARRLIEGSK